MPALPAWEGPGLARGAGEAVTQPPKGKGFWTSHSAPSLPSRSPTSDPLIPAAWAPELGGRAVAGGGFQVKGARTGAQAGQEGGGVKADVLELRSCQRRPPQPRPRSCPTSLGPRWPPSPGLGWSPPSPPLKRGWVPLAGCTPPVLCRPGLCGPFRAGLAAASHSWL